jgi:hypothetical protein
MPQFCEHGRYSSQWNTVFFERYDSADTAHLGEHPQSSTTTERPYGSLKHNPHASVKCVGRRSAISNPSLEIKTLKNEICFVSSVSRSVASFYPLIHASRRNEKRCKTPRPKTVPAFTHPFPLETTATRVQRPKSRSQEQKNSRWHENLSENNFLVRQSAISPDSLESTGW